MYICGVEHTYKYDVCGIVGFGCRNCRTMYGIYNLHDFMDNETIMA